MVYKIDEKDQQHDSRSLLSTAKMAAMTPAELLQKKLSAQSFLRLANNLPSPKPFQVQVVCYVVKVTSVCRIQL